MNRSEEIKQLAAALNKAQAAMKPAIKNAENPFYHSMYADLSSVWDAIRVPFTENGFSIPQFTETKDGQACVTTVLMHISGEWLSSELILPTGKYDREKNPIPIDTQAFGGALSYARRYALAAICGVATEDDDSEGAMDRGKKPEPEKPEPEKLKPARKFPPDLPDKKPKKSLPTQKHKEAWNLLLKVYEKDLDRIKLAIESVTEKNSLYDCTEEEVGTLITALSVVITDMETL